MQHLEDCLHSFAGQSAFQQIFSLLHQHFRKVLWKKKIRSKSDIFDTFAYISSFWIIPVQRINALQNVPVLPFPPWRNQGRIYYICIINISSKWTTMPGNELQWHYYCGHWAILLLVHRRKLELTMQVRCGPWKEASELGCTKGMDHNFHCLLPHDPDKA